MEEKRVLSWTEKKALKRKRLEDKLDKEKDRKKDLGKIVQEQQEKRKKVDHEHQNKNKTGPELSNCGRHYTVSLALPGSILDNAQSRELQAYLAGQIARAAVVFSVDEIVIFDESSEENNNNNFNKYKKNKGNTLMARILQFLECPQYLRKSFFPMHEDLKYAGLLNPLDSPHHMRITDVVEFREGVVLERPTKSGNSFVNIGLYKKDALIDRQLQPGIRVTVQVDLATIDEKQVKGKVVSPSVPRTESGLYWGYNLRLASNLSSVFTQCPHKGGYDLTIGTSERGQSVDEFEAPEFKHAIVVFGGVQGLEISLAADKTLDVDDPSLLFQHYLNTCPTQGSRTIRTEEAILITMASLRPTLISSGFHPSKS